MYICGGRDCVSVCMCVLCMCTCVVILILCAAYWSTQSTGSRCPDTELPIFCTQCQPWHYVVWAVWKDGLAVHHLHHSVRMYVLATLVLYRVCLCRCCVAEWWKCTLTLLPWGMLYSVPVTCICFQSHFLQFHQLTVLFVSCRIAEITLIWFAIAPPYRVLSMTWLSVWLGSLIAKDWAMCLCTMCHLWQKVHWHMQTFMQNGTFMQFLWTKMPIFYRLSRCWWMFLELLIVLFAGYAAASRHVPTCQSHPSYMKTS